MLSVPGPGACRGLGATGGSGGQTDCSLPCGPVGRRTRVPEGPVWWSWHTQGLPGWLRGLGKAFLGTGCPWSRDLRVTAAFRSPVPPAHQVPVPAASQAPASHTPLPPRSSTSQTSLTSAPQPRSKVPQAPREGALGPSLAPWLSSAVPTSAPPALGEASPAGRSRRDERWLLVALLVPTCVFLVVLLALGIVYCTRCGPHAPNKRVTDCYRWVTHAGSKGPTEPAPHRGSLTGVQTCRTSV